MQVPLLPYWSAIHALESWRGRLFAMEKVANQGYRMLSVAWFAVWLPRPCSGVFRLSRPPSLGRLAGSLTVVTGHQWTFHPLD